MSHRTLVLNLVGLHQGMITPSTPNLYQFCQQGTLRPLVPVTPAVTCSVQSTFLTGKSPSSHGIVANGWYFRDLAQVWLWRQSNHLVEGEKVWDAAKLIDPQLRCASLFWWYNMYSSVDFSVTPRPLYLADGRKIPDIYSHPAPLRDWLQQELGPFPLFHFWGPRSDQRSSQWIADASILVQQKHQPDLFFVYLPHLDYSQQKFGPDHVETAKAIQQLDAIAGQVIDAFQKEGYRILLLSEYAIYPVNHPIFINRILREHRWLKVRTELGLEVLDPGASDVFAVADHQIAHVYVKSAALIPKVKDALLECPFIDIILSTPEEKAQWGLLHSRSGEIIALAKPDAWFSYYYWFDDDCAPDFARTVDIHNKPGYDPVELFLDPTKPLIPLQVAWKLLKKKIGFRSLMDVIPLDATLVKGSHGRVLPNPLPQPIWASSLPNAAEDRPVQANEVYQHILDHLF